MTITTFRNSHITDLFIKGLKSKVLKIKRPNTQVTKRPEQALEIPSKQTFQGLQDPMPSSSVKKSPQNPNKTNFAHNTDLNEISTDQIPNKILNISNNEADATKTIGVQIKVHHRKQYLSKYKGKLTKRNSSVLETEVEKVL